MDDKVKVRCPYCMRMFREKCNRVRDSFQVNCQHCNKLITFTRDTEDPFLRRALKTANELRAAKDAEAAAIYLKSAAKREPTY
jgi:transposase-like protein